MGFRIVDFSSILYPDGMPAVRQGKFVHLVEGGEEELLVLSPYELSMFHAQILERYCNLKGVEGRFIRKPELYEVIGADIKIIGGGHWKLDEAQFQLALFGESTIYGGFGVEGLEGKVRALLEYENYKILIK